MGPDHDDVGSIEDSIIGAFHFSIPNVLSSIHASAALVRPRLDRDGGIAYLSENTGGGPVGEEILRSSASVAHQQTHGGT
jgi:hypothetical protein